MDDFQWIAAAAARVATAAAAAADQQSATAAAYAPLRDHPTASAVVALLMARESAPLLTALVNELSTLRAFERAARENNKAALAAATATVARGARVARVA